MMVEEGSYFVVEKEGLTTISMQIGNKHVALNNENKILDAAPLISQNRTMVPLRFIAEAFGADVSWAQDTKTVTIVIDGKVLTMRINQDLEGFGAAPIISNGTHDGSHQLYFQGIGRKCDLGSFHKDSCDCKITMLGKKKAK